MGQPRNSPAYVNQTAFSYTSTQSIFTLQAGPVQMVVTFLSSVTPNDLLRSSLPQTYMNVDVKSTDGKTHSVQLYSDISAEWVSGDREVTAQWEYGNVNSNTQPKVFAAAPSAVSTSQAPTVYGTYTASAVPDVVQQTFVPSLGQGQGSRPDPAQNQPDPTFSPVQVEAVSTTIGGMAYHRVYRQQQLEFAQRGEQAEWGYWYFATANTTQLTFQSGADDTVRSNFMKGGNLPNTKDTAYRAINNAYPVFGYAVNVGQLGSTTKSTLWQISE